MLVEAKQEQEETQQLLTFDLGTRDIFSNQCVSRSGGMNKLWPGDHIRPVKLCNHNPKLFQSF